MLLPDQDALQQVLARVRERGLPIGQTEAGVLLHDPSQNDVVLAIRQG